MIEIKSVVGKEDGPKPKPISKLLKAILIVTLFLFSMDFGLIKCKSSKRKITIKMMSLAVISLFGFSFFVMAYYTYMAMGNIIWYSRYLVQICSCILILMLTPENKTFYSFLNHMHSIDAKIGVDSDSFRLDIKILAYWVASVACKMVLSAVYCTDIAGCIRPIWLQVIYLIPYSSMDFPLIIFFFIFYAARCRLIALRKFIKNRGCEPIYFQYLYKSLIDSTETVKKAFDPIFYVTLFVDIPCIMIIIYGVIKEITIGSKNILGYVSECVVVLSSFFVIFIPAIAAGSLSNEVDKIKICFYDMLLEGNDPQKEQEIKNLINYMDARPFKFTVLGVVSLDGTLPLIVLNLCVTYIIVLLQLTHLY